MNLYFNEELATGYSSASQKIRIMSESWVEKNIFCPCCGNPHIQKLKNNEPVADFQCDFCGSIFELKSKKGSFGKKIADGAYVTMIERITSTKNPDLFVLSYSDDLAVTNMVLIPKFFFVPEIIEKRKPLAKTARRAGWVGCNILLNEIPVQGKIGIVVDRELSCCDKVVCTYKHTAALETSNIEKRGWILDVLNCVNSIPMTEFTLKDVYGYVEILQEKYVNNHNIEAKIRQQMQILRDKGFVEFLGRGRYRKL